VYGNAVLALWFEHPNESGQLPQVLVCEDGTESDWAAWITTFAAKLRPFSAYMRLLPESKMKDAMQQLRTPTLGSLLWPVAGLVLGEVLAVSRLPDKTLETLSATAPASTLSFVMFRAAAMYGTFDNWLELVAAWETVRRVTKQRSRPIDAMDVAHVCATIMQARGFPNADKFLNHSDVALSDACQELINRPERPPSVFLKSRNFGYAADMMHGPREERVIAFERFAADLANSPEQDADVVPFMLGYLASRIAPGTIRHSTVLEPVSQRYPTAALWYGFCAGLGGTESGMPVMSIRRNLDLPGGARRVARDLLRNESILAPPTCDIDFQELLALSRTNPDPLEGLITTTQGTAMVDLVPTISTAVNVSAKPPPAERKGLSSRERNLIGIMGQQIDRLRETYKDLFEEDPLSNEDVQPSLFPRRRKKR
jgi:hypothetical protein